MKDGLTIDELPAGKLRCFKNYLKEKYLAGL